MRGLKKTPSGRGIPIQNRIITMALAPLSWPTLFWRCPSSAKKFQLSPSGRAQDPPFSKKKRCWNGVQSGNTADENSVQSSTSSPEENWFLTKKKLGKAKENPLNWQRETPGVSVLGRTRLSEDRKKNKQRGAERKGGEKGRKSEKKK